MKGKHWVILALVIIIGAVIFMIFYNNKAQEPNANYETSRVESRTNTEEDSKAEDQNQMLENSTENNNIEQEGTTQEGTNQDNTTQEITVNATEKEEEIATFTTKILTYDSSRQKNISITCSTLNDTVVENGQTFSFCNTVGQATTAKGYEEADIFDANGEKKKGLGGGNCQVSTTLYNAVLAVPSLVVTERHAHSNKVPYIESGKDAAVATGSYDFKFRNDSRKYCKNKSGSNTIRYNN